MRLIRPACILLLMLCSLPAARAQAAPAAQGPVKTEADYRVEAERAKALIEQKNYLAALPMYEELYAHDPKSPVYDERLALGLLAKAATQDEPQASATRSRAKQILLEAKANGDNSNLMQTLLEQMGQADAANPATPKPVGYEYLQQAEKAFAGGDMAGALAGYQKALDANPKFYEAALFAGDAEYKSGHLAEAGAWYAKAIAIDPDRETAYRYWGDALDKSGDHERAEAQYIQAMLAQPYQRAPRLMLKQWADANKMRIVPPPIKLPAEATQGKNGGISITVPDTSKGSGGKSDPEMATSLVYSMNSALWQGEKFKKTFPNEKTYRHSLAEELDGIQTMLSVVKEQKIKPEALSTSTRLLLELDSKGMLACWILLDNPDQGVAQDYAAYRKDHRELLAKYVAEYDLHPM